MSVGDRFRLMLLLMLLTGALLAQPASTFAQETGFVSDTEYVLTYGATLAWDDPWVADEDESGFAMDQLGDYLVFEAGSDAYMQFATLPAVGDLSSYLDGIAGFVAGSSGEVLEAESDKKQGHAFVRVEQGVSTFASIIVAFRTDDLSTEQVLILLVEADEVADWITNVQETFTLDGEPILNEIDAEDAQDTFDAAAVDDDGADDGIDDKKIPEDPGSDSPAEPEDESSGNGLTDDRSYESPQFGTTVSWNQRWLADETLATSDTDAGVDYLALNRRGGESSLYVSVRDASTMTPDDWLAWFEDDVGSEPGFEILESNGDVDGVWVMFEREVDGTTVVGYAEAYVGDGDVLIVVELAGPVNEREFAQLFGAAQSSVSIDGSAPFIHTDEAPEFP